jgi:hypothetical protein
MSVSYEFYRGAGDRIGTPIVEPMLNIIGIIYRGRAEMDAHAQRVQRIDADVVYRPGLRLGQLVALDDPIGAAPRRAKTTGIALSFADGRIDCSLTLEEPMS